MRKGFLTENKKDPAGLGPLRDERSTRSIGLCGWGQSTTSNDDDPWVQRFQEVVVADQHGNDVHSTIGVDDNPYQNISNVPYKTSTEPINALGCYYSRHYHTSHLKMSDFYFTWNDKNPKSHLLLWTAIFICPLSGELYMSGKWPGNDVALKDATPSTNETDLQEQGDDDTNKSTEPPDDSTSPIITYIANDVDNRATVPYDESATAASPVTTNPNIRQQVRWMKKKKIAEHGAAAWAYDCFQHRHKQSTKAHRILDTISARLLVPRIDVNLTSSIGTEIPYLEDMAIRNIPPYVPATVRILIEERLISIREDRMKFGENIISNVEEELAWFSPEHANVRSEKI